MQTRADSAPAPDAYNGSTRQIVGFTYFTFVAYFSIGLPLAVLPPYVHLRMGYSAALAGLVISIQYIATLVSRPWAGRISDRSGAKVSVLWGMGVCSLSGAVLIAAAALHSIPWLSLLLCCSAVWCWASARASARPARRCGALPAPDTTAPPKSSPSTASAPMAPWRWALRWAWFLSRCGEIRSWA